MPFRTNPFVDRMSERTSDHEFVRLFSPRVFERLETGVLDPGIHLFRSAPGAGKTTLLRAMTPAPLKGFWRAKTPADLGEAARHLEALGAISQANGPTTLGVLLSCASGYADLPPSSTADGRLFRALFDCRVVLRTLLSIAALVNDSEASDVSDIGITYPESSEFGSNIPRIQSAPELLQWAQDQERQVLANLDDFGSDRSLDALGHARFESVLWLQHVGFTFRSKDLSLNRLLMIDDVQKLARSQRRLLFDELFVMRPQIPIWMATRNIIFAEELLSHGSRIDREIREYHLEELWGSGRSAATFAAFAQSVMDRRMQLQDDIPGATFRQCLREQLDSSEVESFAESSLAVYNSTKVRNRDQKYQAWFRQAEESLDRRSLSSLIDLFVTRILVERDAGRKQLSFDMPLSMEEFEDREGPQVRAAAEIFLNRDVGLPYYYGIDRLCTMATNNIEELLAMAAALFDGVHAKVVLRKGLELSPSEQEKLIKMVAKKRLDFIPRSQFEGNRAQKLIRSIGAFCQERTFRPNAPIAPGVTGVRLSDAEMDRLSSKQSLVEKNVRTLLPVLAECTAENLLVTRPIQASSSRPGGTAFYLNRCLCAHFGLPLQLGGWQEVSIETLADWMTETPSKASLRLKEDA